MNKESLFRFYEKLYFHEIEMREKLNGRIQIYLAIIAAQFSLIAFIINNTKHHEGKMAHALYVIFLAAAILLLAIAIYHFVRSWYNYEYAFLPSANDTEEYRKLLIETYKDYNQAELLVESALKDYIYQYYAECSSKNTKNNDQRSIHFHKTARALIFSFCSTAAIIALFYLANMNSTEEVTHKVQITNPVRFENQGEGKSQSKDNMPKSGSKKGGVK